MDNSISVLFVAADSIYKGLVADCYDASRDARSFELGNPVVAHPPCQLWGKLARVNFARWGGEHNRPGNDGGLFDFALSVVNQVGGVLEHPAQTYAWERYGLVKPVSGRWTKSGNGWVCEVWQSAYGHLANKKTWLYYVGKSAPIDPLWDKVVGKCQVGFPDRRGKERNKPTLSKRDANATPVSFALYLIGLARHSRG